MNNKHLKIKRSVGELESVNQATAHRVTSRLWLDVALRKNMILLIKILGNMNLLYDNIYYIHSYYKRIEYTYHHRFSLLFFVILLVPRIYKDNLYILEYLFLCENMFQNLHRIYNLLGFHQYYVFYGGI
jgi:hypothetical protein